MNYIDPSFRRNEAIARQMAAQIAEEDMQTAERMASILQSTKALLAGITFRSGYCPAKGYDMPDVLNMLDDMTPTLDAETRSNMAEFAYDRANDEMGR